MSADPSIPRQRAEFRYFARAEGGAAAVMFAITLLPIALAIGGAVDYSRYTEARAQLESAADQGALAAALAAKQALAANKSNWKQLAKDAGARAFAASTGASHVVKSAVSNVSVARQGANVTASLTYKASVPTLFMKLVSVDTLAMSRTATATAGETSTFFDVSLALDVSPSMAIAASAADISKLQAATPSPGCAFACHDSDGAGPTYYDIARANKVVLRIDILKSAAQALTTTVSNAAVGGNHFKMGVYGLSYGLTTILPPTASMPSVTSAIAGVDFDKMSNIVYSLPAPAPSNLASGDAPLHYADTDLSASLNALAAATPKSGAGGNAASAKQIAIVVTDGVNDVAVPYNSSISATYVYPPTPSFASGNGMGKTVAPIAADACDALKAKGATVAVLYVPYTPLTSDPYGFYQAMVQTNAPQSAVVANLKACASSADLYYEATDQAGMTAGLATLFTKAAQLDSVRLTN